MAVAHTNDHIRFEPDENPPLPLALGAGLQSAAFILGPVALTVVIVGRIAGQSADYLSWGVFAALLISGATTILQAVRVGRFGSGHVLMMGTSGTFIAVCANALALGGPATMATLVAASALFQFILAARLSWLRRIFTPTVSGTVIMLIAVTVMPLAFDSLGDVPADAPPMAALVVGAVTLIVISAMVLRAPSQLRLWAPVVAMIAGTVVSVFYGLYDMRSVLAEPVIGLPKGSWPGMNLTLDGTFWALLPAFVVATIVGAIETVGDGVAIQSISRRTPKATDFRVVQGALNADGLGNLLSGLAGTLPNTTYSSSISMAEVTGVASRRVGVVIGAILGIAAFFPVVAALLIAIPGPVLSGYLIVIVALLFVQGMRMVVRDGLDHQKAAIVGVSFWLGVGFQNQVIFPELLGDGALNLLLSNGMTSGAIVAILMTLFVELTGRRRRSLNVDLSRAALSDIEAFLHKIASDAGWNDASLLRLTAAGEETLEVLLQQYEEGENDDSDSPRRLVVTARMEGSAISMDFVTALEGENLEDRLGYLGEMSPVPDEYEVSYRLLQHYASSVRHQKYHGLDIVTVNVGESTSAAG